MPRILAGTKTTPISRVLIGLISTTITSAAALCMEPFLPGSQHAHAEESAGQGTFPFHGEVPEWTQEKDKALQRIKNSAPKELMEHIKETKPPDASLDQYMSTMVDQYAGTCCACCS